MPVKSVDYSKTVFYKLVCRDITITDLYVGSTTDFKSRKSQHKSRCSNQKGSYYNIKVYQFIRENGGWENWDMIMVHRQSCMDTHEAHTIERGYIETLKATLNCYIPSRGVQERYDLNIEAISTYQKSYREANEEKLKEQKALYREANKEKLREQKALYYEMNKVKLNADSAKYREDNKNKIEEYLKNYRDLHKDNAKDYSKLYREENKEKIKATKKLAYEKKKLLKKESLVD